MEVFDGGQGRKDTAAVKAHVRKDLGGTLPVGRADCLLALWLVSDVQVLDAASPARCEWVELLASDPKWQPLLHMHRPYEALTHWALAAHVDRVRRDPCGPCSQRPYDLALSLGDNIDNAQRNELDAFLAIVAGGRAQLAAWGSVQDATGGASGSTPWPYWCPDAVVDDPWKRAGYPAIADYLARASEPLLSHGLGFAWSSLPGNHDLMRQGTALPDAAIEAIATHGRKLLQHPPGFEPNDPLVRFVEDPAAFSRGGTRTIAPLPDRRAVDRREWIAAHVACGAAGYSAGHATRGQTDTVVETEHATIVLLDTNHPLGDYQGSVGEAQLQWLEQQLAAVDKQPGRIAVLSSHHGSVSLTNTRGADPRRQHAQALTAVLHRHPSVVAWLVGHRHLHEIRPHRGAGGGFWEISTASLIDWPAQARAVEFLRHAEGQTEIACTLQDHGAPADTPAGWHHALARRFAGAHAARLQGTAGDGNVRLVLAR
jgi:metallophosphoesterase (TIGR03767 family)